MYARHLSRAPLARSDHYAFRANKVFDNWLNQASVACRMRRSRSNIIDLCTTEHPPPLRSAASSLCNAPSLPRAFLSLVQCILPGAYCLLARSLYLVRVFRAHYCQVSRSCASFVHFLLLRRVSLDFSIEFVFFVHSFRKPFATWELRHTNKLSALLVYLSSSFS